MAEVDPLTPQVVDPELTVNLTRLLQIRGPLGVLNVLDTIVPVVSLGNVVTPDINIRQPVFRSTDVFSNGLQVNQPINTILADTGALPTGIYDVMAHLGSDANTDEAGIVFEHRNAANTANLAVWEYLIRTQGINTTGWGPFSFSYELAVNERLRLIQRIAGTLAVSYVGVIFARTR